MKWILIIAILTVAACSRMKDISVKKTESTTSHNSRESTYIEKKDTTFNYHPAPEHSANRYSADSSHLETSLAWSTTTWKDGILSHTIENKPSVPIRVPAIIQIRTLTIRDTVAEYLSLTEEHTETIEKFRFLNPFFYYSGIAAWIITIITITLKTWKTYKRLPKS